MNTQTGLQKVLHFFLTKIIVGIIVIAGSVFLVEWLGNLLPSKTALAENSKNIFIAISDAAIAVISYVFLFRWYEKRRIDELSLSAFNKYTGIGFATGFLLQSIFITIIFIGGAYSIIQSNSVSVLIAPFADSLRAGFVAEILIVGVFFRIMEEKLGTAISLAIMIILFAILHINSKGASVLSVCSTAMQAGFMLPAAYVCRRNLWLPVFIHFGWDFTEPGIYGGTNPGISIAQSFFTSRIEGNPILTGGETGPQNSIQGLLFCIAAGITLLVFAKQKNNFILPGWRK
jgi:membrane protease YdiL (CAAX protease family)